MRMRNKLKTLVNAPFSAVMLLTDRCSSMSLRRRLLGGEELPLFLLLVLLLPAVCVAQTSECILSWNTVYTCVYIIYFLDMYVYNNNKVKGSQKSPETPGSLQCPAHAQRPHFPSALPLVVAGSGW